MNYLQILTSGTREVTVGSDMYDSSKFDDLSFRTQKSDKIFDKELFIFSLLEDHFESIFIGQAPANKSTDTDQMIFKVYDKFI